jgi:bifunctional non-homologous end joining protein LigD
VNHLKARSSLIDGEAVARDENGLAVFEQLRRKPAGGHVFLYAFDLLELDGQDLRRDPLETRKAMLTSLLRSARLGLQLNEHIAESGDVVFRHACKLEREDQAIGQPPEPDLSSSLLSYWQELRYTN